MKVLSIDPGYGRLGYAIGDVEGTKLSVIEFSCLETSSKKSLGERYLDLSLSLEKILNQHQPEVLVLEKLYFARNTTTALRVSESRGIVIAACLKKVRQILEFAPSEIKLCVTGHGQADKAAVKKMTLAQLKIRADATVLDDAIDALAILLTFSSSHSVLLNQSNHAIL